MLLYRFQVSLKERQKIVQRRQILLLVKVYKVACVHFCPDGVILSLYYCSLVVLVAILKSVTSPFPPHGSPW